MIEGQISLFDSNQKLKITKPIRLIELFAGYGSQHFALEYLGANFESWKVCEWAVKSIQAYKDAHFKDDNTDYSKELTKEQIFDYLANKGISANYNEPMTIEQVKRLGEEKARVVYNNIKAINNLVNIQQVKGKDLDIVDTDKYCYIMTYSFPCQDLSSAGLGKGMAKDSGTRSGMLWEVERILNEIVSDGGQLPQVLLMENVPQVHGTKNKEHFVKWINSLESLGYKNYYQDLNSKNYGIPQNRNRCFMVSVLGNYCYQFPKEKQLEILLKDILEDEVDEKYYLSDSMVKYITSKDDSYKVNENSLVVNRDVACSKTTREGQTRCDCSDYICDELPNNFNLKNVPKEPQCIGGVGEKKSNGGTQYYQQDRIYSGDGIAMCHPANLTSGSYMYAFEDKNLKEQLCNQLIKDGKVKEFDVIRHSYSNSRMKNFYASNKENNNCSPTLDTRCDCLGVVINSNNKRLKLLVEKTNFGEETLALDCYNQVTHENCMQTIKTNVDTSNMNMVYNDLRIRKLTPKECFRLMGVKDEDFEKIAENQSNASLYHLAGDSIVVDVLMAIFKEMLC